ncbi:hypothetical protein BH23ACT12_BH23ACT12_03350 [soil metagenome]
MSSRTIGRSSKSRDPVASSPSARSTCCAWWPGPHQRRHRRGSARLGPHRREPPSPRAAEARPQGPRRPRARRMGVRAHRRRYRSITERVGGGPAGSGHVDHDAHAGGVVTFLVAADEEPIAFGEGMGDLPGLAGFDGDAALVAHGVVAVALAHFAHLHLVVFLGGFVPYEGVVGDGEAAAQSGGITTGFRRVSPA